MTWGELDDSMVGRRVIVRWEDGSEPLGEGLPSGVPHEYRGEIVSHYLYGLGIENTFGETYNLPEHALVQMEGS